MEYFRIELKKNSQGLYIASAPAFGIPEVCGQDPDTAIAKLKEAIESEGALVLAKGETIIKEELPEGKYILGCDFMNEFKKNNSEVVRRAVSLPKWMDIMVRKSGVDSSSLFRDAFMNKIEPKGETPLTVEDIKDCIEKAVKEYMSEHFR